MLEETGLEVKSLKELTVEKVKSYTGKDIEVHAFRCKYNGQKLDTSNDPDNEVFKWEWISISKFPEEVKNNLHSPKNVTLNELGIMEKAFEELNELLKAKALPIGTIRVYGGVEKIKTAQGWLPVPKNKEKKEESEVKAEPKKEEAKPEDSKNSDNIELTNEERDAVKEYQAALSNSKYGGYTTIQGVLRTGKPIYGSLSEQELKEVIQLTDHLSSAINKQKIDKETTVYRGLKDKTGAFDNIEVGQVFSDKGFISTSKDLKVAKKFTEKLNRSDKQVLLHIKLKPGDSALDVDKISKHESEKEILLNKNQQFKVVSMSNRNGVKILEVELSDSVSKGDIEQLTDLLKGKEVPVGTVSGKYKKVGPGDWRPVGNSAGSKTQHDVAPSKQELTAQQHNEQASMHYEEALKIAEVLKKFDDGITKRKKVDSNFQVPDAAKEKIKELKAKQEFHMKNMKVHRAQGSQTWKDSMPKRAPDKTDPEKMKKSVLELNDFLKSIIAIDEQGSAIDTAKFATENAASQDWLHIFTNIMQGFNYGDSPREIVLSPKYKLNLVKVDDGLYSGIVRQEMDWDDKSALPENVAKLEKQTIPSIIQFCMAKEFIQQEHKIEEPKISEQPIIPEPENKKDSMLAEKIVDLLNKLLS